MRPVKGGKLRRFLSKLVFRTAFWIKLLWKEVYLRAIGAWPPPSYPAQDRWERRKEARKRGLVTMYQLRRSLLEKRYSTRKERKKLAKMKLPPIKKPERNPKTARRKFKLWYNKLMEAYHKKEIKG